MARPNTKDWKALENAHQPSGLHVIVTGLAELSPGEKPVLTERAGQAEGLELELTTADSNESNFDAKVWKAAQFHKEVEENQYNSVRVFWKGTVIAEFPVLDDRQHALLLAKRTAAQNKTAGAAPAASTAKKAVKKAVDAVKEVVGKVAEAVTGGAKKPAKKAKKAKKVKKTKAPKAVGGWAKKRARKAAKKAPKTKKKAAKASKKKVAKKKTKNRRR